MEGMIRTDGRGSAVQEGPGHAAQTMQDPHRDDLERMGDEN